MKKLIVAEKPSVARDIARVLGVKTRGEGYLYGGDYVVTWARGHLVEPCDPGEVDERWQKWRMGDLPMLPREIPLRVAKDGADQFAVIKKLMNSPKIDSVICATDAAREGELIFRNIYIKAGCVKPVERLWISSMTDAAILKGFETLKSADHYDALYESARSRAVADWLVGMNASRAFSLRYDAHLSVGRVQTPTLNLIVRRDREIAEFVPKDYWEIRADFGDYEGLWVDPETKETRCTDEARAKAVAKDVRGKAAEVLESVTEVKKRPPEQLFDLTSLQREANKKLGFSADRTLNLAQALYEKHKLLTYPRTDSRYLPDDMAPKIEKALKQLPAAYRPFVEAPEMNFAMRSKRFYDNEKISDHHAIVPTERKADPDALNADERAIYDMVVRRLIAAHYPDYEYESARIVTGVGEHRFRSTGAMPLKEGWRALYRDEKKKDRKEEKALPRLTVGDERRVEKTSVKANKTKPPEKMTDAAILAMMENAGREIEDEQLREEMKNSGLGTPATRAATIERLIQVGYARREGKAIVSTDKGRKLIAVVPEQISSPVTTGKWEKALHALARYDDAQLRADKSARFRSGIDRFSEFLVAAAKAAPDTVAFEDDFPKKRRPAARKK